MNSTASVKGKPKANTGTGADKPKQKGKSQTANKGRSAGNAQRARGEPNRGSFPFTVEHFTLNHNVMKGAFNRYFNRYRRSFYHVTAVLQKLELDDGLELVHEYVSSQLDDAEKAIATAKAKALAVLEAQTGSKHYRITSPNPATVEAKIPSFLVRRFMNLFKQVDDYIDLIVFAEGMGAISFVERQKTLKNSPRYVTKIAGRFQSVATQLSEEELRKQGNAREVLNEILEVVRKLKPIGEGRPLALQKAKKKVQPEPANSKANGKAAEATSKAEAPAKKKSAKKTTKKKATKKQVAAKKPVESKGNGAADTSIPADAETGSAEDWGVPAG